MTPFQILRMRTAAGGGGPTPTSLLHFDGSDGSNVFTDESGKIWSQHSGTATLSTTFPEFGSACLQCALHSISTPDHADWDPGSGDFLFDFWIRAGSSIFDYQFLLYKANFAGFSPFFIYIPHLASINFAASNDGSTYGISFGSANGAVDRTGSVWHHVEFSRTGNSFYGWLDGAAAGSGTMSGALTTNAGAVVIGGTADSAESSVQRYNGRMDEFHYLKGTGGHTSSFTPPASPYTP